MIKTPLGREHPTKEDRNLAMMNDIFAHAEATNLVEAALDSSTVDWSPVLPYFCESSELVEPYESPFRSFRGPHCLRDSLLDFYASPVGKIESEITQISALQDTLVIRSVVKSSVPLENTDVFLFDDNGKIAGIYMHWADLELLNSIFEGSVS